MTTRHNQVRRWSQRGTEDSAVLNLRRDAFTLDDPRAIAATLKQVAEASRNRRSTPFRAAMSMLTFHINRAGDSLDAHQRQILEAAKDELRIAFGRDRRLD